MQKLLMLLFLVLFATGCTSIPKGAPAYSPAPAASTGDGILYIYRLGAYPTLRTPEILINGKTVINLPEKAYTWVYLSQGKHKVTVDWAWDTGWPDLDFDIPIEAGKEHYLKLSGSFDAHFGALERTWTMGSKAGYESKNEAEAELISCCKFIEATTNK